MTYLFPIPKLVPLHNQCIPEVKIYHHEDSNLVFMCQVSGVRRKKHKKCIIRSGMIAFLDLKVLSIHTALSCHWILS